MRMSTLATACVALLPTVAFAHDGRRFDIKIIDDKLTAHGYISGSDPVDDGGGIVRPYYNALHGHWANNPAPGVDAASTDLPGFDLFAGGVLTGSSLSLTLTGALKWEAPPMMPPPGTIPDLVALDPTEEIFVGFGGDFVSTEDPGTLLLAPNISAGGLTDIDLTYDIGSEPSGVLYVLEFVLSTDAPGVLASDTINVILSPDGDTSADRLHHAALFLEGYLGTPVPAPGTGALLAGVGILAFRRYRAR